MQTHLVIVSGFTAAGKSTHSRLLASSLGWGYLGISELRRSLLPRSVEDADREWSPATDSYRLSNPHIDLDVDELLSSHIAEATSPLVVDAWLQPWLCENTEAVRLWISSSFESRVLKARVSYLRMNRKPPSDIEEQIRGKDGFSVEVFRRLYGISFGPDPERFDLVLDNSRFLNEAAIPASDAGIAAFHGILLPQIVAALRGKWNDTVLRR